MALYTIGEVALLCDINPVTLRAWQRRYGLLKPQRTDGGHRLFNDSDIDRIREIKRWIDNGVQVSKVKMLLSSDSVDPQNDWRRHQETLLHYLQSNNLHSLRAWLKERGQDYPAQTLTTHLFIPLRRRLQYQQATLQALLGILDGVLINYIAISLAAARKKQGKEALVVGWNIHDTTRLWLEAWVASQQGWRVDVLAHSLSQFRPELFEGRNLLVWCGENQTPAQQQQLTAWRAQGHAIYPLGI
ncbi:HTH-type transcriptional regulator MlrA [Citrobacter rodentium]|uniref:HTH-type transcriptional regulator MlrA n=2 Tax=Citrobacter rodentium TaxID=67825 RepID=D2TQQ6_CITRI|nr:HTH-type transcriptional regulator MlrA [Citrobacter rodentium]KIQ52519.1 MerR family transcriptional regulator [Citrobacter rodentium]QBY28757.1 HTH-type transcriptional regulator MlrA [Citrobacter rodentium]UHO29375.1 HTH-type transcriptional regulator MlrA [Citrobacter rodentium NBRC 105723 = DSM 16636]CBG88988.1 MerR-family transcriptional regulator [Citrobacter rodentium ICC168]HAT8011650.1 transcriptional regulator [Citrobacter rodentium NBRC 105723 = DSM 16636]